MYTRIELGSLVLGFGSRDGEMKTTKNERKYNEDHLEMKTTKKNMRRRN